MGIVKSVHFRYKKDYLKWLAYGHIHKKFKKGGHETVYIRGKKRKVTSSHTLKGGASND